MYDYSKGVRAYADGSCPLNLDSLATFIAASNKAAFSSLYSMQKSIDSALELIYNSKSLSKMKILIIGVNNQVSDAEVAEIASAIAQITGNVYPVHMLSEKDFASKKVEKPVCSDFMRAVADVVTICGDPEEEEAFRGNFWVEVLRNQSIGRPVLELLALGPKSRSEQAYIRSIHKCEYLPVIAKAALMKLM